MTWHSYEHPLTLIGLLVLLGSSSGIGKILLPSLFLLYGSFVFWHTSFWIQDGFGPMVWIGAWCSCYNWCSGLFFGNYLAVFVCFTGFPFEFFGHYVEYLRQCLPFLANLKVNFLELTIMYPTVLCHQKYMLWIRHFAYFWQYFCTKTNIRASLAGLITVGTTI